MNTDQLIERLAQDAGPVRSVAPPAVRTAWWLGLSALYVAILVLALSPSLERLTRINGLRFWLEQISAMAMAGAAAAAAFHSVVPGRERGVWALPTLPLAAWLGAMVFACLRDWHERGLAGVTVYGDPTCVVAIVFGATLPLAAMIPMLQRGAPMTPALTLALAALAGTGLGSVAGCLSRASQHGSSMTVLVWHFGLVAAATSIAALSGRQVFRWRPAASVVGRLPE